MINNVSLGGKIVSDIELRKSKSGISVIDFRLMYKNIKAKNPLFIDIEAWGNEAEKIGAKAKRGDRLVAYGELRRDVWTKDGEERSKIKITAERVILVNDDNVSLYKKPENHSTDDKAF